MNANSSKTDARVNDEKWSSRHASSRNALELVLVGVLPTVLVMFGNARFVLNLFYARAPFLRDASWFSAVSYRAGLMPRNPAIAEEIPFYWGVHPSPLISLFSLLSYIAPVDRITWYAITQAFVHAPLGAAVYFAASRSARNGRSGKTHWAHLLLGTCAAIAFAFSAQVLVCIQYPHIEAAISGWICVLLASIVTKRRRWMWASLVLAIIVREDAGFHCGLALVALFWVNERLVRKGATPLVERRLLTTLIGIAFGTSVLLITIQKLFFQSSDYIHTLYLGTPPLAHLTGAEIAHRFHHLAFDSPFITVPFLGTALIAIHRRDAGYLLGWAATLPWLVLNMFAVSVIKAEFRAYTGFPFIVSLYWLFFYGSLIPPIPRRLKPHLLNAYFVAVGVASVIAYWSWTPWFAYFTLHDIAFIRPSNRDAVMHFREAILRKDPHLDGLAVDDGVGGLAIEALGPEQLLGPTTNANTIAFNELSNNEGMVLAEISRLSLTHCTHLIDTPLSLCRADNQARAALFGYAVEDVPSLIANALEDESGHRFAPPRGIVTKDDAVGLTYAGHFSNMSGAFEVVWELDIKDASDEALDAMSAEVVVNGVSSIMKLAKTGAQAGKSMLVVSFVAAPTDLVMVRLWHWLPAAFTITRAELRRAAP